MPVEHVDVLVVGAGLSGIGAACHLQKRCPGKRYVILEGRSSLGGTWDVFRYPGIRSDSDMYTLGYSFKPWTKERSIADGASILEYLRETAREHGIEPHIRFNHRVVRASWSSADACWQVEAVVQPSGETVAFTCGFLFMCSGYYDAQQGYMPEFPGIERYAGRVVHAQQWTPDIDPAGRKVVVIGSGATAVTLVPSLAQQAAHVTMLQRSPTYVVARPASDRIAGWLRRWLPSSAVYRLARWKNVLLGMYFYRLCKRRPVLVKQLIVDGARAALPAGYDVQTHFTPAYKPWDQRLCLAPDGDLFAAIRSGRASVATGRIETFTEKGIRLESGAELEADLVVAATGLNLRVLGGLQLTVDGTPVDPAKTMNYKGMMYSGVPNLASSVGYTNASWTLKCDLTCAYVCRLLKYMDRHGYRRCMPLRNDPSVAEVPWIDFSSGYIQRSLALFPKQGSKMPWRLHQNYVRDLLSLRWSRVNDGVMEFT